MNIGTPEIIVILALALILFGPKKLPEIGRSIGEGLREIKKASRDIMGSFEDDVNDVRRSVEDIPQMAVGTPLDQPESHVSPEPVKETTYNDTNATDSDRHT